MTENTETQQTGLTIQDLTLTLQAIQVASSRGAFKADELSAIGGLYDRIFKFLEAAGAINTQPAPTEQPAEATTEPVVTETPAKKTKKAKVS